jgi:hypothetical protein
MLDYQVQPHTRRCVATGRELQPGEKFYSALIEEKGKLVRQDFSSQAWQGPPSGTFSFWSGRVPGKDQVRKLRIDAERLLECFQRLDGACATDQFHFRYVLALLLIRAKRFKFLDTRREAGREILRLRCVRGGTQYDVVNPQLTADELAAVQEQVLQVIGWE